MAKIALIALLLIGLAQIILASTSSANMWSVWSDFKAYAARVASDDALKPALSLGGEDDFLGLVDKLRTAERGYGRIGNLGILQVTIAVLGLFAAFRKKKQNTEPSA